MQGARGGRCPAAARGAVLLAPDRVAKRTRAARVGGLAPKKRGPKTPPVDPREQELAALRQENATLRARAERAEFLIEIPKKVSTILGVVLPTLGEER